MILNRNNSLTRAFEFARVRQHGNSFAGRFFVVNFLPVEGKFSRFGLICTKKVGNAVLRNRLRRQLRSIIRATPDNWKAHYDVVVVIRWRAAQASFIELQQDFLRQAAKAKVW